MERLDEWNPLRLLFKFWKLREEVRVIDLYLRAPETITSPVSADRIPWLPSMGQKRDLTDG